MSQLNRYHNDTLLDPASYSRDQRVLELHNLKPEDAGSYYCKVKSLATAEKASAISQSAILSLRRKKSVKIYFQTRYSDFIIFKNFCIVTDPMQSACDEIPIPNIIRLPDDCKVENSTLIDIGSCASAACPTRTHQRNGCGEKGSIYCCGPVERVEIKISCEGNNCCYFTIL